MKYVRVKCERRDGIGRRSSVPRNQESQDAKPFVEQMGMDKAFAESHACDGDTEEEPNGTRV